MPVAIETAGSWNQQAIDNEDIGTRICVITEELLETIHLFQCIPVAIHRGNVVSLVPQIGPLADNVHFKYSFTYLLTYLLLHEHV